jgi:acyl-CoA dehydrogenase
MSTAMDRQLNMLMETAGDFAADEIATRPDLYSEEPFPQDIWRKMGKANLLGLGLPKDYGGLGGNYLALVAVGETLVARGHNLGIVLSWLIHSAVARFLILGFGSQGQKERFLPPLARGHSTAALAASEPGTGAHPGHMRTQAAAKGDTYVLNGEKTYLTNGPIADLYVVFAVTGKSQKENQITAFLVPSGTRGLSLSSDLNLGILGPSPHCGLILENASVPTSAILGTKGRAYEQMIKPFRDIEDTLMTGPLVGGMTRQLDIVTHLCHASDVVLSPELKETLGLFQSLGHALRTIAHESAAVMDDHQMPPGGFPLLLAFRHIFKTAQSHLNHFLTESGIQATAQFNALTQDIHGAMGIADKISRIKQRRIGESVLAGTT